MSFRRMGLVLLVILAVGCTTRETSQVSIPSTPTVTASSKGGIIFIGHRDAAGEAPENTLAAFQRGLDIGVDAVELDVHLSKDDELVVIHDPHIERISDGTGIVRDLMFADIRRVNAAAKFKGGIDYGAQRIPTLQEVYDLVATRGKIHVEIKLGCAGQSLSGHRAEGG